MDPERSTTSSRSTGTCLAACVSAAHFSSLVVGAVSGYRPASGHGWMLLGGSMCGPASVVGLSPPNPVLELLPGPLSPPAEEMFELAWHPMPSPRKSINARLCFGEVRDMGATSEQPA